MLPPSTRSPQLLSLGFSAGHCGEDPVKDRRPLDREAQRVTPEASSHCEPTSGEPCAPVRAARCWILYAPFFRARANSAWAGLRARILYRPCPGGRIQGGRSGSSTSFTSRKEKQGGRQKQRRRGKGAQGSERGVFDTIRSIIHITVLCRLVHL